MSRVVSVFCLLALALAQASPAVRASAADLLTPVSRGAIPVQAFDAAPSPAASSLGVFVPNLNPGLHVGAGLLLLQPGADNLGWSTITTFLPLENPQWAVQTLDPTYQPGLSVFVAYTLPDSGKDVQVNWEHLQTHDTAAATVANPNTQWVSPFSQTGPSTSESPNQVGIFHLKSSTAQVDFGYDMLTIDAGQTVNLGSNTQVRLLAGLACVWLSEQLITTFNNDTSIEPVPPVVAPPNDKLTSFSLNNTSTYTGLGPRIGFATAHNLSRGFSFVSQLSGSVLGGTMQPAEYSFAAVLAEQINAEKIASPRVSQVVYAGDAKLGIGYLRPFANGSSLSIETGFKAAVFINPFATYETSTNVLPLDIGSLSTNSMRHTPSNFTLNGFYANCSLRW